MDPLTIGAIIAGLAAGGASIYGAYKGDKQDSANRSYQMERNAIADRRQGEQDRIAERERRREAMRALLDRERQKRQLHAGMWHPSMARPVPPPSQAGG